MRRYKMGMKELSDNEIIAKWKAEQRKRHDYAQFRRVKQELIVKKAHAAGLTVSDDEVDDEIAARELT